MGDALSDTNAMVEQDLVVRRNVQVAQPRSPNYVSSLPLVIPGASQNEPGPPDRVPLHGRASHHLDMDDT